MLDFDHLGRPVSLRHRAPYKRAISPWNDARSAFVDGTRLQARWRGRTLFSVVELGFGLGVNFLVTLDAWERDPLRPDRLVFVSIEAEPLSAADLERAHDALGLASAHCVALRERWPVATPGVHRIAFFGGAVILLLACGSVETLLPGLDAPADAFYLDGFEPALNPQMWSATVMRNLARLARPGAFAAADRGSRQVRESLAMAGFEPDSAAPTRSGQATISARFVSHRGAGQGFARTRPAMAEGPRQAIVIGAGLAGCAVSGALGARGWEVQLLESERTIAAGGSRQPVLVDHPHLSPDDNRLARLSRSALSLSRAHDLDAHEAGGAPPGPLAGAPAGAAGAAIGRLVLAADEQACERQQAALEGLRFPQSFVGHLDRERASSLAGVRLAAGGLWYPGCRAADPAIQCRDWIDRAGAAITLRTDAAVASLQRRDDRWIAFDANGSTLAQAPVVILANAGDAPRLGRQAQPGLRRLRGQSTILDPGVLAGLRTVVGADAFACPLPDGRVVVGSTFDEGDSLEPSISADHGNLSRIAQAFEPIPLPLAEALAAIAARSREGSQRGACSAPASRSGSVGYRWVCADRLPMIGALPDEAATRARLASHMRDDRIGFALHEGLYGAFAFGSRGLLWARLAAEVLGATLDGEPVPLERDLLASIDPARFLRRAVRRARL
ncbi:MAG: FAD-dependent 5-carboxymethylaminomethyl-2-thiouridine(34) oxidoreductase MnmC [Burkholderiaceae bacterium]|nr:FAD-dependent 5-carboxymethylaminomethyl-2-thiouridine(34) oxidoreductase MnmC [Burkholderiaceae bacterium]